MLYKSTPVHVRNIEVADFLEHEDVFEIKGTLRDGS